MPGLTIALVDDDPVFIQMMQELLAEAGHQTITYMRSDKAFEFIRQNRPDLVMLDLRMGDIEAGWTVLDLMRLDPVTEHIAVVICSAHGDFLHEKAAFFREQQCVLLPKPFTWPRLMAAIEQALALLPPLRQKTG